MYEREIVDLNLIILSGYSGVCQRCSTTTNFFFFDNAH